MRDELLAGMRLPLDHDDDVALLVVHVPQWQGERAQLFRSAAVDLVGGTEIAAHARAFASGVLRSWQLGEDLCDIGVLAVSELVANAAIHGRPPVRLRLRRTDRRLIVDVCDGDDHLPRRRLAEETDEDGRGIGIVASLAESWGCRQFRRASRSGASSRSVEASSTVTMADSWGCRQLAEGKSVWCEFTLGRRPGRGPRGRRCYTVTAPQVGAPAALPGPSGRLPATRTGALVCSPSETDTERPDRSR